MAEKDYYQILGISSTATADEIKSAYRKLARKYHPDVTGGDKSKEALFKDITQAYEVLGDTSKRAEYDNQRRNPFGQTTNRATGSDFSHFAGFSTGGGRGVDMGDFFSGRTIFDEFDIGMGGTYPGSRGMDIRTDITISLAEAALGAEKTIVLEPDKEERKRIKIRIPAGVEEEETIRVPGKGRSASTKGGEAGDLYLTIHISPHPRLRRNGIHLETELPISLGQAVLGAKVEVETLEGPVQLTIPPETSSGQKLRLRGKGGADRKGGHGDLFVTIQIMVPKNISAEAKQLIKEFSKITAT